MMTSRPPIHAANARQAVLFPTLSQGLIAVCLSVVGICGVGHAETAPYGRSGALEPMPRLAVGVSGSAGENSLHSAAHLEMRFAEGFAISVDVAGRNAQSDELTINGAFDVEERGQGIALYYQLSPSGSFQSALVVRYREDRLEDDAILASGASRVAYQEERRISELAILGQSDRWTLSNGIQPYAAVGVRQTIQLLNIDTLSGRPIQDTKNTEYSGQAALGLEWRFSRGVLFSEFEASSDDHTPWRLRTGLRLGLFSGGVK